MREMAARKTVNHHGGGKIRCLVYGEGADVDKEVQSQQILIWRGGSSIFETE